MISLKTVTTYSFQLVSHRTGNMFLHLRRHSFQTTEKELFPWMTDFPEQEIFSCKQISLLMTLVGYKRHLMMFDVLFLCHPYFLWLCYTQLQPLAACSLKKPKQKKNKTKNTSSQIVILLPEAGIKYY